ncbi:cytochrome c oxidase subunit 2 [Erythromicrobium ramosum]|uniref:Cytochrome c oxidase subunit 2 n=1 Tax=Erythrobacter ramosus TaxID=35811 RepID=A0A6I4UHN6_9SPHN|nr:cytochrome c oxidase subunit II [Erythrobacter ramosus]MBB3776521.1 cytochrome c oxidase subunit 2 [Erythrobacter ramosus]MXP38402.1 cytochrome c oxidase subunit II [Erythrobacter ramosus]
MKNAILAAIAAGLAAFAPLSVAAQVAPTTTPVEATAPAAEAAPATAAPADAAPAEAAGTYTPMAPTKGKGMPTSYEDGALKSMTFQDQYSENGKYAQWMHDGILMPVITAISLLVLGLLLYVVVRFNRIRNPVASRTTHNTAIEVIWTIVPVIILVVIAVPSITLLARQYETPPADAVTIKATGYQWYWGYTYPDHGEIEVISNMLDEGEAVRRGEPGQLAVDNRMVVPAGVPLRIQTTASDVIHAFAVPSLWFKMDAVPGRLNEKLLTIEEPGVYYGQCSELCGARHAYMPIAIEALPPAEFAAWVKAQGGSMPGEEAAAPAAAPAVDAAAAAAPAAAR